MSKNKTFFQLDDKKRLSEYKKLYNKQEMSWAMIAKMFGTYTQKVRRDAVKLGIISRDKSSAQKIALSSGRVEHPTEGKEQTEDTKLKISQSQGRVWDNLSEEDRLKRSEIGLEAWNKKTEVEKLDFFKKSSAAIQRASKEGSKVEKRLLQHFKDEGYNIQQHLEQTMKNDKFHIDLYIPECRVAIEIDGPMHFESIYGDEKLRRRQAADLAKNGLILSSKMVLIRVKLVKRDSQRYMRELIEKLTTIISKVEKKFPPKHERYFEC